MEAKTTSKKKLKNFLTVSFVFCVAYFLAACSCFPKEINIHPKQILTRFNKCKQYQIVNYETLQFKFEKDLTLDECLIDGYFVLSDEEIVELRSKLKEAKKCYDEQCKAKNVN